MLLAWKLNRSSLAQSISQEREKVLGISSFVVIPPQPSRPGLMEFLSLVGAVSIHPETTMVIRSQWLEGKEKDSD